MFHQRAVSGADWEKDLSLGKKAKKANRKGGIANCRVSCFVIGGMKSRKIV